jgi:hypothetical protein
VATPQLDTETMKRAVVAYHQHGSVTEAARALGVARGTFDHQYRKALQAGITLDDARDFEFDDLPSELPTAAELIKLRKAQFQRKTQAKEARHLVPVRVKIAGPFGLALPGDPHVDDDGTDIALLEAHVDIINRTEGLLAGNIGDYSNNWIGRLARLYGQQATSAAQAWVLVEWYVRAVPWLFLLGGNHDLWSGDGDPIKWMARQARVQYEANGMRLGLTLQNGRVIRVNGRHDFSGKSQWNTAHGPAKAAQLGWRDHVLVCGHTHQSGYQILRDPASGLISHAIRVGSYKTFDRYAEEKGLPNQTISPCVVVVVQPDAADDSPRLITVFQDVETGADFLTFLRKRKSGRAA